MFIYRQNGAVSITVLMFLPIMCLLSGFVIYTSQMYLSHIKTIEAAEVAALALIARDNQEDEEVEDVRYAESLVKRYLSDSRSVDVSFRKHKCEYDDGCVTGEDLGPYSSNTLTVTSFNDSWLKFLPVSQGDNPFFDSEIVASSGAVTTERYSARPLDVYFVVDFSGSMTGTWGRVDGVRMTKIDMVKYTVERILAYLNSNQDPDYPARISLATYSDYNYQKRDGKIYRVSHNYRNATAYCPGETVEMMWIHPLLWAEEDFIGGRYCDNLRTFIFNKVADTWGYYDIAPTLDYDDFNNTFSTFTPSGGTYSWQGLIAAAQQADIITDNTESVNPEQIFILLSDGDDAVSSYTRDVMDTYEMCHKIKARISGKENRFSELNSSPTNVTMAVIGLGHNVYSAPGFRSCFGNKIYLAEPGTDDVYKQILNLLNDATGRFSNSSR